MQSTECQSYLNQSKVDICATLWCIYNLSGVYTDVVGHLKKDKSTNLKIRKYEQN
jgi:hypothetical protein